MINLKEQIAKARAETPKKEGPTKPAEPTFKLKGVWQKKDDSHQTLSFVGRVTGIGYDQTNDRETLELDFKEIYSEVEFTSPKGAHPEGVKTWFLPDGLYKARIYASKKDNPSWSLFAVVDGQKEDLTEEQVFHIFAGEGTSD